MKISNALEGYWLDKRINFSQNTVNGYTLIFNRLIKFLRDPEFEKITSVDIRRFLAYLADEYQLSHKSLSNAWIALSSLWTWAETELKTPHVIRGKIKRPKYQTPVVEPFTEGEVKRLLDAVEGKFRRQATVIRNRAIIITLLDTGLRASELCDLTIADYDQTRARLHIRHGKNDKQRFVPVGQRAQKALWRYLSTRTRTKPGDPLFATKTGNHLDRDNLRHLLDGLRKTSGVSGIYPHRFRHT